MVLAADKTWRWYHWLSMAGEGQFYLMALAGMQGVAILVLTSTLK